MAPTIRKRHHEEVSGHELLGLVRSLKKKQVHANHEGKTTKDEQESDPGEADPLAVRSCLLDWTLAVQCVGLLKGDTKAAESVLNSDDDARSSDNSRAADAKHVLSSVLRILEGSMELDTLVPFAAKLVEAICEYAKTYPSLEDVCYQAEVVMISNVSKPMLSALLSHVELFHDSVVPAATSIVTLMGPKLSRSTDLLNRWHDTVLRKHEVKTGAKFLSVLPLLGGRQIKAAELYTQMLEEYVSAIRLWINNVASVKLPSSTTKVSIQSHTKNELRFLDVCKVVEDEWLPEIRSAKQEADKVHIFTLRLRFLVGVLSSMLRRENLGSAAAAFPISLQMLSARATIDLDLLEDLILNFASASKHLLLQTKQRLRSLTTSSSVLSIASTAASAEAVQLAGHKLLQAYLSTIGPSGLLPFAKRLENLCVEALWQSTPMTIQQALEPLFQIQGQMDASMYLRTSAIRLYRDSVSCFGMPLVHRHKESSKANRALTVLCATVIVTFSTWPQYGITQAELVDLLLSALQALTVCFDCCGSNMALSSKNLVDSVAYTCLKAIHRNSGNPIIRHWKIRVAILRLSSSCCSVPLQDESACYEFWRTLHLAAQALTYDQVHTVVSEAVAVCKAWQTLYCPRRPLLHKVIESESGEKHTSICLEAPFKTMREKLSETTAFQDIKIHSGDEQKLRKEKNIGDNKKALTSMSFLADANHDVTDKNNELLVASLPKKSDADELQDNEDILFDDGMPVIVDCDPDNEDME